MERPVFQPVGTPVEELDTPALVLDLDVATSNIQRLHQSTGASTPMTPEPNCTASIPLIPNMTEY